MPVQCTCSWCGAAFRAKAFRVNNGEARFCGVVCAGAARRRPLPERFWEKVDRSGGPAACWPWLGHINGHGYGSAYLSRGRANNAHRIAYELAVGSIPPGLEIDHVCRVRACCNPAHLEAVTRTENQQRSQRARAEAAATGTSTCVRGHVVECLACRRIAGRLARAETPRPRKVDEAMVRAMRAAHAAGSTFAALARHYGISHRTAARIVYRDSWAHVD